jgi:predicted dehydrogenase
MVEPKGEFGVGLIGAGRMGSIRAHLLSTSPSVNFLAISDADPAKARALSQQVEAGFHSGDNRAVIEHPGVRALIVSTPEGDHTESICAALALGKPVLVEKPIALTLEDADRILAAQAETGADLFIGYTQRLRRRYLAIKGHIDEGRLGEVMAARMSIYHSRADAPQMIARSPGVSPFTNSLTYMADMALWFFAPRRPVRVYAQGGGGVLSGAAGPSGGFSDYGWAIVTFEDGAAVSLGVSWILPEKWPAYTASIAMEIFGADGSVTVDDGHRDVMMVSGEGTPAPDPEMEVVFLGSAMPGDWAQGDFIGPMRDETRLFLERVENGREVPLCDAEGGRAALELTLAMELSARAGGELIDLPLKDY